MCFKIQNLDRQSAQSDVRYDGPKFRSRWSSFLPASLRQHHSIARLFSEMMPAGRVQVQFVSACFFWKGMEHDMFVHRHRLCLAQTFWEHSSYGKYYQ